MFSQPNYPSSITRLHEKEVFLIFFSGELPWTPPFRNWPDHICIASSGPAFYCTSKKSTISPMAVSVIHSSTTHISVGSPALQHVRTISSAKYRTDQIRSFTSTMHGTINYNTFYNYQTTASCSTTPAKIVMRAGRKYGGGCATSTDDL